jgi:hypothetical protein
MREIRLSGSVRGVRSKPYPYRDSVIPAQSAAPGAGAGPANSPRPLRTTKTRLPMSNRVNLFFL